MPPPWWYNQQRPSRRDEQYREERRLPAREAEQRPTTTRKPESYSAVVAHHDQDYRPPQNHSRRPSRPPDSHNSARRQDTESQRPRHSAPHNQRVQRSQDQQRPQKPPQDRQTNRERPQQQHRPPHIQPLEVQNRYTPLEEELTEDNEETNYIPEPKFKPKRNRRGNKLNSNQPSRDQAVIQLAQPDAEACRGYFLPGRVGGHPVSCLVDSGCTMTVLSYRIFTRLRNNIRAHQKGAAGVARVADGSTTATHGEIELSGQLRHWKFTHNFLIADIQEDVLIGIDFLQTHGAALCFRTAELQIGDTKLQCQDADGYPLMARVQLVTAVTVPPRSERILHGRLDRQLAGEYYTVEHNTSQQNFLVGTTLASHEADPYIRLLNPSEDELILKAGKIVAMATPAEPPERPGHTAKIRQVHLTSNPVPEHMQELFQKALNSCSTTAEQEKLQQVLTSYADVFSSCPTDIGHTNLITHTIPTKSDAAPVKQRPRRLGAEKEKEVDKQIEELQQQGLIEPSHSAWSSPVVMVKKRDGSWRFCIDYRKLNELTIKDAYPLPRIDDSLDALSGSQYFSTLDLVSGYWQVALDSEAREKSAFVTRNGLWQWRVLPFGLTSAPSTFERLMERVLRGLHWKNLLIYLDDVVIFSRDIESHLDRLEEVLKRFRAAGLKLKPSKCELFQTHVKYLGHIVSGQGVSTDPEKVKAVSEWPRPTTVTHVRAFLGLTGYYRRFITNYADIARPLHKLTNKAITFEWGVAAEAAFNKLKQKLIEAPILGYPDPNLPYIVDTDASDEASGAVLSQIQNGMEKPIAYFSKTFSNEEKNYCVTRRELLAVVKALKQFRPYLYGREFKLRTDHESLTWMLRLKDPRGQVARWLEELAEFQYKLEHRRGTSHNNADGLSRRACGAACKPCQRQLHLTNDTTNPNNTDASVVETSRNTGELDVETSKNTDESVVNTNTDLSVVKTSKNTNKPVVKTSKNADASAVYTITNSDNDQIMGTEQEAN